MMKTDDNGLIEDLIVTGFHSILVDDLGEYDEKVKGIMGYHQKIDDKYLLPSCMSNDFVKLEDNNIYTYYHLTLENDGDDSKRFGIWANGILTETTCKNDFLRNNFTLL